MLQFRVADMLVDISTDNNYIFNRMQPFINEDYMAPDLSITINKGNIVALPEGEVATNGPLTWLERKSPDSGFYGYMALNEDVMVSVESNHNWYHNQVNYFDNYGYILDFDRGDPGDLLAFMIAGVVFRSRIVYGNSLAIHASAIDAGGRGLVFTAPSGTGKSTHVSLWERYVEDVKVLNDDTPVLRLEGDAVYIYGTPWSGSTDKFLNARTPLTAIIVLEQAPENSITRLSVSEAISSAMPRFFLPYMDKAGMKKALQTFEKIVSSIPVYRLGCRPDREAVDLVYEQCMK